MWLSSHSRKDYRFIVDVAIFDRNENDDLGQMIAFMSDSGSKVDKV